MKQHLKNIFTALSAFLCLAAMVAWGFGMAGWGVSLTLGKQGGYFIHVRGERGGLEVRMIDDSKSVDLVWYTDFGIREVNMTEGAFVGFSFDDADRLRTVWLAHHFMLPYWLLILAFAPAPALWLRRRYVERRDKRLFEQIKREKLREGTDISHHKDTKTPRI